jgi:hypothetical protein
VGDGGVQNGELRIARGAQRALCGVFAGGAGIKGFLLNSFYGFCVA